LQSVARSSVMCSSLSSVVCCCSLSRLPLSRVPFCCTLLTTHLCRWQYGGCYISEFNRPRPNHWLCDRCNAHPIWSLSIPSHPVLRFITSSLHHFIASPHHHFITSLLHRIITSSRHCFTASSLHRVIVSPHHPFIASLFHRLITSSRHCFTASSLHRVIVSPHHHYTAFRRCHTGKAADLASLRAMRWHDRLRDHIAHTFPL
jgi:hypothetical protein